MKPRNTAGAGPAHKHEARRLQNLTKQRERLEADVRAAEEEILHLVLNDLHLGPLLYLTEFPGTKESGVAHTCPPAFTRNLRERWRLLAA